MRALRPRARCHQALVGVAFFIAGGFVKDDVGLAVVLQGGQHVEAASAAVAFQAVGAVGHHVQLIEDEVGDDELALEQAGAGDLDDPAVNQHAGVQQDRASLWSAC